MEGTRFFDHEPCLVGERGEIGCTFELQQKQGIILGGKTKMFNTTKTLEEVLATKAQGIWIMLLFAFGFFFFCNKRTSWLMWL
jgi:hypothetical protein